MTDPIKAALEKAGKAAAEAMAQMGMDYPDLDEERPISAAAIAAFLWHIRDASEGGAFTIDAGHPVTLGSTLELGTLAAAVEAAAREGGGWASTT